MTTVDPALKFSRIRRATAVAGATALMAVSTANLVAFATPAIPHGEAARSSVMIVAQDNGHSHGDGHHHGAQDPNLAQHINADEATIAEGNPVTITSGHIDIGPVIRDGKLQLLFRDDRQVPPVWRHFNDAVFVLGDAAKQTIPDTGDYAFIGAQPGAQVWAVPQNQVANVPWLGWSTQAPSITEVFARGMTFEFSNHTGPGDASLFVQSGGFSGPQVLYRSADNTPQSLFVDMHSHTHLNWVFTEPGAHTVTVTVTGTTPEGKQLSSSAQLAFAVGEVTPKSVRENTNLKETTADMAGAGVNAAAGDTQRQSDAAASSKPAAATSAADVTSKDSGSDGSASTGSGVSSSSRGPDQPRPQDTTAIVGLIAGSIAVLGIIVAAVVMIRRRSKIRDDIIGGVSRSREGHK